jgi:hypothetical protein
MIDPFGLFKDIPFLVLGIACVLQAYSGTYLVYDDGAHELSIINSDRYRHVPMTTRSRISLACLGIGIIVMGLFGIWGDLHHR